MNLLEIVTECAKRRIPVSIEYDETYGLCFSVSGFSKSGEAKLMDKLGTIECHTRYDRVDVIDSFDALAAVAYDWYMNYRDRAPFEQPGHWAGTFVELGWLRESTASVTSYSPC